MNYLLDTNTRIGWLRQSRPNLISRIQRQNPAHIYLCFVVLGELIYGAYRSGPAHQSANLARVAALQRRFVSIPFDDRAAAEYGKLRAYLTDIGQPIGPNDLIISAIALAGGLTLVTHNTAEFSRVPALSLEDWQ